MVLDIQDGPDEKGLQLGHMPKDLGDPFGHTLPLHVVWHPALSGTFTIRFGEPHSAKSRWAVHMQDRVVRSSLWRGGLLGAKNDSSLGTLCVF